MSSTGMCLEFYFLRGGSGIVMSQVWRQPSLWEIRRNLSPSTTKTTDRVYSKRVKLKKRRLLHKLKTLIQWVFELHMQREFQWIFELHFCWFCALRRGMM